MVRGTSGYAFTRPGAERRAAAPGQQQVGDLFCTGLNEQGIIGSKCKLDTLFLSTIGSTCGLDDG